MKTRTVFYAILTILFITAGFACAHNNVIDLGTLGGTYSSARSINDNGQIVGQTRDSSGYWIACLFDNTGGGANKNLGSGGDSTIAQSINNSGQSVGTAYSVYGACLFDSQNSGNNKNLGTLGGTYSSAYSINNNGQVVGVADNVFGYDHACLFDKTGGKANKDLGTLGGNYSWAVSINNNGQIAGFARNSSNNNHATLFDPTGGKANTDLGTLGGDHSSSSASCINDSSQIVGAATVGTRYRATLFDSTGGGANKELGTLGGYGSWAYSINNNGQIVGWAENGSGQTLACLFDATGNGNNIDLNTLIDPSSGWTLQYAYDINNNGWIVGQGTFNGQDRAFLLVTPEPATICLFAIAGLMLRRKK